METEVITLIQNNNDTALVTEFVDILEAMIPVVLPVAGGMAILFFSIWAVRKFLNI